MAAPDPHAPLHTTERGMEWCQPRIGGQYSDDVSHYSDDVSNNSDVVGIESDDVSHYSDAVGIESDDVSNESDAVGNESDCVTGKTVPVQQGQRDWISDSWNIG